MAITKSTDLTNAVVTKYLHDYLLVVIGQEVWGQYVDFETMREGSSGTPFNFPAFNELDVNLTALDEESDAIPTRLVDDKLEITPQEYGRTVSLTRKARFRSRVKMREVAARIVAGNRVRTVDRLIRNGVLGGTNVIYAGTATSRVTLDVAADLITYAFLQQLHALAMASDIEPIGPDNVFIAPIHPLLAADIKALTEYKEIQYRRPVNLQGREINGGMQPFIFAGFHFIPHKWGKVYMSGGTVAQAATTITAAVSAGGTSVTLTDATGIAAGDYITIGTLEAVDAETVLVTDASATPTLVIKGVGNKPTNQGFAYDHAALAACVEADFAAALPILGRNSLAGVYAEDTGRYGVPTIKEGLDTLDRFMYLGWKWDGGVSVWPRYVLRAESAVSKKIWMVE